MEGLNLAAFLVGYLAVAVFGLTSLVALGLLVARYTRAARLVFATGLLGAAIILALAVLSFFAPEFRHDASAALLLGATASLLLAGAGQFIAALRDGWTYAAAFGCTAAALVLLASPMLGGDWVGPFLGELIRALPEMDPPWPVAASLVPAVGSVAIAVLLPGRPRVAEFKSR